jgi:hypothetical protein
VTVPHHNELIPKTAKSILSDIARHQGLTTKEIVKKYKIKF